MGLSASQMMAILQGHQVQQSSLVDDKKTEDTNLDASNAHLDDVEQDLDIQLALQVELAQEMEDVQATDPMNQLYCGIKEFVIENQGMCGMGMGMGSLQLNSDIKLTGKELLAMSSVLTGNTEGKSSAGDLVEQLKSMGVENAALSEDGNSIEIVRPDGSKVKFCDANGDGMLNGCDYDFSDALAKFNKDLNMFNERVAEVEKKQAENATRIGELEAEKAITENEVDDTVDVIEELVTDIDVEEVIIDDLAQQIDVQEAKEDAQAIDVEVPEPNVDNPNVDTSQAVDPLKKPEEEI